MRLFLGLPIPPELARTLAQAAGALNLANTRLTPPDNLHLTLIFLGQVGEDKLPPILRELNELSVESVQLRFTHVDLFPRAGVLFAEIEPVTKLLSLHTHVSARMARCGFPLDDRPYHPHVTLARLRSPIRLTPEQTALPSAGRQPFIVDVVNLYRSHTLPTGARYEILAWKAAPSKRQ
jgi:2'-5' RNA ligase